MDDGFILWPTHLDIRILARILDKLHPNIKHTIGHGKIDGNTQSINFLDVKAI